TASIAPKVSLDLRVIGDMNLAILQDFTTDMETGGNATLNAAVRGTSDQPLINGRLEVRRGTVHFTDTPTGLCAANGPIIFIRTPTALRVWARRPSRCAPTQRW